MFTPIVADATTTAITNGCHHRWPGTVPSYPQYLEAPRRHGVLPG
jgi:hypothetical protein